MGESNSIGLVTKYQTTKKDKPSKAKPVYSRKSKKGAAKIDGIFSKQQI